MDATTIFNWLVLGALLLVLVNVVANLVSLDGLQPAEPPADPPLVSVLVPARNEELNIETCIGSLLKQDYPNFELFVLDDHSDDGTGAIVERLIAAASAKNPALRATLLRGQPLPEGWTGKNWACHQLAQAARGQFLFFTDADSRHAESTVMAAVAFAIRNRAGLLSAVPHLLTGTLGEKLIIPVIVLIGFGCCPLWLQNWIQEKPERTRWISLAGFGAANGQFMFFARQTYERIGGHASVSAHVVEDVSLGRAVAARVAEGERLFFCEAVNFFQVRMYRSFRETWEGFTKNLRAAFDDRRIGFWVFGAVLYLCFLGPFVEVFRVRSDLRWLVASQIATIFAIRFLLAARFRTSWLGALLHPFGFFLLILIAINSWWCSTGKGVVWKGRTYKPDV